MNLFVKIFLWFLAAVVLLIGVIFFLNWTVQTEPVVSRWRISLRNQTNIYADTAAYIYAHQGEEGMAAFLERLRKLETIGEVDMLPEGTGKSWTSPNVDPSAHAEFTKKALNSDRVEIDTGGEAAYSGRKVDLYGLGRHVLIIGWERPRMTPFFGESPLRYLRYGALFLTALLLCWALARYLSSPIGKLRQATQKLAAGDLSTRVAGQVGNRLDELSSLAKDFDVMAERIESLITSQQRLSRDISHELRSPLARMNVALEIAKTKMPADAAPQLARIEGESARLNDMIGRLLTLSKLESGSKDFDRRNINLRSLVEQVVSDADFEAQARHRSVKLVEAADCTISGSDALLRSAVENVLRNAVRYTREGTSVEVSLKNGNKRAALTITDHGTGVPEPELRNLFRPFYRVGEARDRGSGGTGLGLAIAEQAVLAHDGSITARNTDDGLEVRIELNAI